MIEKFLSNEISLPPILALKKKTSIEIPFSNKRSSQEYTPSRVRNIPLSKTLTQKSMPLIGTEDHSYKVFNFYYLIKIFTLYNNNKQIVHNHSRK